jgi:hypothetical protein
MSTVDLPSGNRRVAPAVTDNDVAQLRSSTESKNTHKNTNWIHHFFEDWRANRINTSSEPTPSLVDLTAKQHCVFNFK